MIDESTIAQIKESADVLDVVGVFVSLKKDGVDYVACCPFHDEKTPSFKVSKSKNMYKCFGCGKSGDAIEFLKEKEGMEYVDALKWLADRYNIIIENRDYEKDPVKKTSTVKKEPIKKEEAPKKYDKPKFDPKEGISEKIVKWFEGRKISKDTLDYFKVTTGEEKMPQTQKVENVIKFNYFKEGEIINIKYRDGKKNFKMHYNAEQTLYNLDAIRDSEEMVIVEGEICAQSWHESEYEYVVSVPAGAKREKNNFDYIAPIWDTYLKNKKRVYIAVDNDEIGNGLKEDLLRLFGRDICYIIEYPKLDNGEYKDEKGNTVQKHTKDANDILKLKGPEFLLNLKKEAKGFAIPGVYSLGDIEDEMWGRFRDKSLYPMGTSCYIEGFTDKWSWRKGDINAGIGPGNQGKSTMYANNMPTLKSMNEGDVWAVFSPEAFPISDFYDDIIHTYIGKSTNPFFPTLQMTEKEYEEGMEFAKKHYYFVYPDDSHDYKTIFEKFKMMIVKYGITGIIIDPVNQLDRVGDDARARDDQFLSRFYSTLKRFISIHGLYNMIIIHSTPRFDQNDIMLEPNFMSDVEGGQMTAKKVDNVLSFWRPNFRININDSYCIMRSSKIKRKKYTGEPGQIEMTFEKKENRYYDDRGRSLFTGEIKPSMMQMSMDLPIPEELQESDGNWKKIDDDPDDNSAPF